MRDPVLTDLHYFLQDEERRDREAAHSMTSCPFCGHGGDGDIIPYDMGDDDNSREAPGWQMRCEWCGARGPEESTLEAAGESWNKRKEGA
jgi:hypothetical protein